MAQEWRRRTVLEAAATAGAVGLAGCSRLPVVGDGSASGDGNWPSFQGGPERRGARPGVEVGEDLDDDWTVSSEALLEETDAQLRRPQVSPPVVDNGRIYVALTGFDRQYSGGYHVFALAAEDGALEWHERPWDHSKFSDIRPLRPTVAGGTVYVSRIAVPDEVDPLVALDAATGQERWRQTGEHLPAAAPTIRDGRVTVTGTAPTAVTLDAADGSTTWEFDELTSGDGDGGGVSARSPWPASASEGRVYVPTSTGTLIALDRQGEAVWTRDLAHSGPFDAVALPTTPVLGEHVYAISSALENRGEGWLHALDPDTGETAWTFQPDHDDERLAEARQNPPGEPGSIEQRSALQGLVVGVYGTPVLADGTLYAQGLTPNYEAGEQATPKLFAVDASSGEQEWDVELPGGFGETPPVLAGDVVYVATRDGVAAVHVGDEELLGATSVPDIVSGFAVGDGTLYRSTRTSVAALPA